MSGLFCVVRGRASGPPHIFVLGEEEMKKGLLLSVLILALASQACSFSPSVGSLFASETPTPTATFTSTPTLTETPTPTPSNTPTPTPNATATAAVKATEGANTVLQELDALLAEKDSDLDYKNGYLAWQQTEPEIIALNEPGGVFSPIGERLQADDFIFKSDVVWQAESLVICGFLFRSEANLSEGKQYGFQFLRFSGLPAWDIESLDLGYTKSIITQKVRFSDALNLKNGATNTFVLAAKDNAFVVYINGIRQGKFYDDSRQMQKGRLAFLASEDGRKSSCTFKNSWLWALNKQ